METLLIRADGGENTGMGHLMRCIAFAEGCLDRSITPVLVTRNEDELNRLQLPEDAYIESIPEDSADPEDLAQTLDLYDRYGADAIVTDLFHNRYEQHPELYRSYLNNLHERVDLLVVIDDLFQIQPPGDIALSPGYGKEQLPHNKDAETVYLLGTDYFPFRTEFIEQRRQTEPASSKPVEDIVVTLGGSDHSNILRTVCQTIDRMDKAFDVHVISGVGSEQDWIDSFRQRSDRQWTFTQFCNNMAQAITSADLAITGGGLTKYETALLGVPSIILAQVEHQHELMTDFVDTGTCVYAGRAKEIGPEELGSILHSVCLDTDRLREMSLNGLQLLDGEGRNRILDRLTVECSCTGKHST